MTEPLPAAGGFSDSQPVAVSKWYRWRKSGVAIADYLLDAEVHTFAFSVAANAIISFIPLIVLLYTIAFSVFHSQEMVNVVNKIVEEFLPTTAKQGSEDFLAFWLRWAAQTSGRHGVQALSLVMILISCTGIFLPLEVALNQAWGVTKSRNYLWNQVVAFGLAIWMVFPGDGKRFVDTWQRQLLGFVFFHHTPRISSSRDSATCGWRRPDRRQRQSSVLLLDLLAVLPLTERFRRRQVVRTSKSSQVCVVWLAAKEGFVAVLPHLDLKALYGPFYVSVGLLFLLHLGLILFAGAQFSAIPSLEKVVKN